VRTALLPMFPVLKMPQREDLYSFIVLLFAFGTIWGSLIVAVVMELWSS
jgi:hypothetical protein